MWITRVVWEPKGVLAKVADMAVALVVVVDMVVVLVAVLVVDMVEVMRAVE